MAIAPHTTTVDVDTQKVNVGDRTVTYSGHRATCTCGWNGTLWLTDDLSDAESYDDAADEGTNHEGAQA